MSEAASASVDKEEVLDLVTLDEFIERHSEEPPWVLKPFLTEGSVMMLYGHQGRGKTSILYQLARCVVLGLPWMGFPVQKTGPVIFLQTDMDHRECRLLVARATAAGIYEGQILIPSIQPDFNILDTPHWLALREWCNEIQPALVVLDTADAGYWSPREDNTVIKHVLTSYKKAVEPSAFTFSHHDRKRSKPWGNNPSDPGDDTQEDSFLGWGQWERAPTASSIQLALSKNPLGSRFVLQLHKHRLGHPGFKTLRLDRTEHGFFEPRHDSQQMLLAWPYCLPGGERDEVLTEIKSQRDVFRDIAQRTDTSFETVKSQFQRGRENGAVYDWLELLP